MANEMSSPTTPPVPQTAAAPVEPPGPPAPRRLTRSNRERMWAGVAGGIAEYFDLDPSLVRLLWILATILTWGGAVALYIAAWIILPRDDRAPSPGPNMWRDWSDEFHSETQRLAEEARRVADDMRGAAHSWHQPPGTPEPPISAATSKGTSGSVSPPEPEPWWQSERYSNRYVEPRRHRARHPRSTGIVLVTLGVLLLAAQFGLFNWFQWKTMWPIVFIGLGVLLLARQTGWKR
jgi:phage shock protein C